MQRIKRLSLSKTIVDLIFFSIPFFSLLIVEYAARGDFISTVMWLFKAPLQFFVSLSLFYAVFTILWANINHMGISALAYVTICVLISAAAGYKSEALGVPLMPWDISGSLNTEVFAGGFKLLLTDWISALLLVILIISVFILFNLKETKHLKELTIISTSLLCCVIVATVILTLPNANPEEYPASICEKNGYIRGFIINTHFGEDNEEDEIAVSDSNFQYEFTKGKATEGNIKPNVIFIMSEAFFDSTLLPNIEYNEDPIPNFHALAKECISGEIVSPTYGGSTCNVEFEVLTGFSLKYMPYLTIAYDTCVKKTIPAIPSYYKSLGYQTIAVHPNTKKFFNRDLIYPKLGIDQFIASEEMTDAVTKGRYISDDTFADYIVKGFEQAKKPVFMYNISVQNHYPYTTENYYEDNKFTIKTSKNLDKESIIALQNYAQGIHDADRSLKKVIDYFKNVKEPTVVVFFGDHLPALTQQLGVYKKLGFVDKSVNDVDFFKGSPGSVVVDDNMFVRNQAAVRTPYLIWSNYKTGMEKGRTLSTNYFGVYVMSKIGTELPPFYNFLADYSNKVPVNRHYLSVLDTGIPYKKTPSTYNNYEYTYKMVQDDILFGAQKEKDLFVIK